MFMSPTGSSPSHKAQLPSRGRHYSSALPSTAVLQGLPWPHCVPPLSQGQPCPWRSGSCTLPSACSCCCLPPSSPSSWRDAAKVPVWPGSLETSLSPWCSDVLLGSMLLCHAQSMTPTHLSDSRCCWVQGSCGSMPKGCAATALLPLAQRLPSRKGIERAVWESSGAFRTKPLPFLVVVWSHESESVGADGFHSAVLAALWPQLRLPESSS